MSIFIKPLSSLKHGKVTMKSNHSGRISRCFLALILTALLQAIISKHHAMLWIFYMNRPCQRSLRYETVICWTYKPFYCYTEHIICRRSWDESRNIKQSDILDNGIKFWRKKVEKSPDLTRKRVRIVNSFTSLFTIQKANISMVVPSPVLRSLHAQALPNVINSVSLPILYLVTFKQHYANKTIDLTH